MTEDWQRGSEWKKWDLHIHSPGTKLNDQFGVAGQQTWDDYCRRLHESDVHAFGIADYFSADGYCETVKQYRQRYADCPKIFLPNIELRTNEVVNKNADHVNVHLIFNPFQQSFKENIEKFLRHLKTSKSGLSGQPIMASELSGKRNYEEATVTRVAIGDALTNTFGANADLTDHVLIVTCANNDGIRTDPQVSGRRRKDLISDELDKGSHAFFGNAGNVEWFLTEDRYGDGLSSKPKPTLTGCDAHSLADIDRCLGKVVHSPEQGIVFHPTWIKADRTFEGLKQILYEPSGRAYIGEEPEVETRVKAHKSKYIESLYITSVEGYANRCGVWFKAQHIKLGKELIAIIGNKGSGKSAVSDIVGLLGNTHNQRIPGKHDELFSFLTKEKFRKNKCACASNFRAELRWHDNAAIDKKTLDMDTSEALPEKVEYLPQKYLERICADIEDDDFRTTLNDVIFGYVKEEDRYRKQNFDELIVYLTAQQNEDIKARKRDLHAANEAVVGIEKKLTRDYQKEVEATLAEKKRDLEAHRLAKPPEKPKPADSPDANTLSSRETVETLSQQIDSLTAEEATLQQEQIGLKRSIGDLKQARQEIERAAGTLTGLKKTHEATLTAAGLSFDAIVSITVDYTEFDRVVTAKQARADEIAARTAKPDEIEARALKPDEKQAAIAASIVCQRTELERQKADLIEHLGAPEREYRQYLDALAAWTAQETALLGAQVSPAPATVRGLQEELDNITVVYPSNLAIAIQERDLIAKDIFTKKRELTKFYVSVKASIDAEIGKYSRDLDDYGVSIEAGFRFAPTFYETFFRYVAHNVKGTFYGVETGKTALKNICGTVSDWEDTDQAFAALRSIVVALHFDKREEFGQASPPSDALRQAKSAQTLTELYDFLYGFDYLSTKYDLMVDGKDLSELSPGERGGLLMIFYLMLDRRDIPLVIDQPEDNLDNETVYQILAKFLKKAKTRRQIIMVTHNPNLAVGADAEQIIRVSIDKKMGRNEFSFYSGSIENPRLNAAVVDILEGTLPAFDKRRLKYPRQ